MFTLSGWVRANITAATTSSGLSIGRFECGLPAGSVMMTVSQISVSVKSGEISFERAMDELRA